VTENLTPQLISVTIPSAKEGTVQCVQLDGCCYRLMLVPHEKSLFIARHTCETSFPLELIQFLASKLSFVWLSDAISRNADPDSVQ
jgi:hypothetical protein